MASADVQVTLRGGLGNQLFQYAAALHAQRATGGLSVELVMLEGHYSPDISDFIDISFHTPTRIDRARWSELASAPGPLRPAFRVSSGIYQPLSRRTRFDEPYPYAPPPPMRRGERMRLHGFFWHPDWLEDSWRAVARGLSLRAPSGVGELISERRTVVSLRQRSDYAKAGWVLPIGYYERVLADLKQVDQGRDVVVISDVPSFVPWFEALLKSEGLRAVPRERLTGDGPVDDFWNIASAAHLAIPNSSFAWWAAAVAVNRDSPARVLYPEPWVPNRWNKVLLPPIGLPGWIEFASGFNPVERGYADE